MVMKKRKIPVLAGAILILALSGCGNTPENIELERFKAEIRSEIDNMHKEGLFPGATLGIVMEDGTELSFSAGWADIEKKILMEPDDRMFTGSAGKTFVAAVALQLVDEGKLDLDSSVSRYLGHEPWFSRLPNHAELTVEMIMTHTGGLPRYIFQPGFTDKLLEDTDRIWAPEELLSYVFNVQPAHPPGDGWSYSDTDYIVLGLIIEKICGNDFYAELKKRILSPFELKDTTPSNSRRLEGLVSGYTADGAPPFKLPGKVPVEGVYPINPQFEWCGGGLVTTSLDLARWAKILYEGKAFSGARLREMLNPLDFQSGQPGAEGYGLGVMIFKKPSGLVYGHGGIFPGYQTQMSYFPEWKTAVAMQVNADRLGDKLKGDPSQFIDRLIPILIKYRDVLRLSVQAAGRQGPATGLG